MEQIWFWIGQSDKQLVVIATVLTALIAMSALQHSKKDSAERSRPYVVAALELGPDNDQALHLVVKNYGETAAHNLRVTFDRDLNVRTGEYGPSTRIQNRYRRQISTLAPSQALWNLWWAAAPDSSAEQPTNTFGTPDQAIVTVEYLAVARHARICGRQKKYKESFAIDVQDFMLESRSILSSSLRGRVGEISLSLNAISKNLARQNEDADPML